MLPTRTDLGFQAAAELGFELLVLLVNRSN